MKGGMKNRLSFLFNGPGWSPGKPRLGLPQDISEVPEDIVPYHRPTPKWLDVYILLHFTLMIIATDALIKNNSVVPYLFAVGGVIYLVFSLTSIGMIYDHHPACVLTELARLVMSLGFEYWFSFLPSDGYFYVGLKVYFLLSVSIWSVILFKQLKSGKVKFE
jgi:alkylglycerol monooxygenase